MTYSVFGCVVVDHQTHVEEVLVAMHQRSQPGVFHHLGEHGLLSAGDEVRMMKEQGALDARGGTVPFYLTRDVGEDSSHTLVREDGMHASLHDSGVPRWLAMMAELPHVVGIELFVTEGYDDAFFSRRSSAASNPSRKFCGPTCSCRSRTTLPCTFRFAPVQRRPKMRLHE